MSKAVKTANVARIDKGLSAVLIHTDAAQAIGKIKVDCEELGVDYLTIVGHKFYGPRIGNSSSLAISAMTFHEYYE